MKKIFLIVILTSFSVFSSDLSGMNDNNTQQNFITGQIWINSHRIHNSEAARVDCDISITYEKADGSTVQANLTFVDVTWWDCTKMKVASWLARVF